MGTGALWLPVPISRSICLQKLIDELAFPVRRQAIVVAQFVLQVGEHAINRVGGIGDAQPRVVVPGE